MQTILLVDDDEDLIPPLAGRVNSPPLAAFTVQIPSDTPLLAAESFIPSTSVFLAPGEL